MKILDRYILSSFLSNFIGSFGILMLIFIFQAIWMFIDELAGKGLDIAIVGKFLFYYSPNLIPMVLPLTILTASIITFGNFAENYEFAAMKASGISLQRAMKSIIIFIVLLSIGTFFFANNVIPKAEYKSYNLRRNIAKLKPALIISEGVFNEIGGINLKVEDKYGDNDQFLKNIIIHEKNDRGENIKVIKAKDGELVSSEDSNIIQLILKDGNYYEDIKPKKRNKKDNYPHAKAHFVSYTMNMDLSELNKVDLNEQRISNTYKMLNIKELGYTADSLEKNYAKIISNFGQSIYMRSINTTKKSEKVEAVKSNDSIDTNSNILSFILKKKKERVINLAITNLKGTVSTIENKKNELKRRIKLINLHKIMMSDKMALALFCVVLFFVGAPIGAIVKKGGLGVPLGIAMGIFITYFFMGTFAKNLAEDNSLNPHISSWASTLILLPLGIFLTRRATADKSVFNLNGLFNLFGPIFSKIKLLFSKK